MATERNDLTSINRIAGYLKVPAGKLAINNDNVISRSVKNKTLNGFATIVNHLARESKELKFEQLDVATQCQISQWFDYVVLFVIPALNSKQIADILLRELDEYLLTRSYFVDYSLTLADVVIFYVLYPIVSGLPSAAREEFVNLTRWFNHMQLNRTVRQNLPAVNLTNTYLHGWTTGAHV